MPPARFTLDGDVTQDGWPNFQVDGYGTWLWSLLEHVKRWHAHELAEGMGEAVGLVSAYLQAVALDTCFDCWEENGDALHTSTLACTYGGLRAASALVGSSASSQAAGRRADDVQGLIAERAVLGGRFVKSSNDAGVDASLLWLAVPFGAAGPSSPAMTATAQAIEETLDLDGGTRRYQGDTYYGGGAWPLLTAWLGWYRAVTGDMAAAPRCEKWVEACFDTSGQLPEQLGGAQRDPASYSDWVGKWGPPAADLAWSHAMFLVLQDQLDEEAAPRSEGPSGTPQRNRQTNPTFLDSRGTSVTGQERG
jgi:GH15 family glucan-1,4-alpha-glucosidase